MVNLISEIKENNEDFEFYPTTNEIISALIRDLKFGFEYRHNKNFSSFLDIGAGNGKVLQAIKKIENFEQVELYAIEKAITLRELLDKSIYIIGTDFYEQSLLDKNIDITFCNPPYSAYEDWAKKIIRESASKCIYLVIPKRWTDSEEIAAALKYRDAKYKTIGEFNFENAEDRTARAVVNLIRIELSTEKDDAFDRFFNEEFKELKEKFSCESEEKPKEENKFTHMVLGKDYVKNLVQMYNEEIKTIQRNYELAGALDATLLKEFDITPDKILKCLKGRLCGLKNLYWNELITRMSEITNRLTSKKRKNLLDTLQKNGHVDFTVSNIYAVILWILKHAGNYIDKQLIDIYEEAISKANCKNYKSNSRVFEYNHWRYNEEKPSHIYLEYRIVLERCGRIEKRWSNKYQLTENACEYIKDLLTIANNLGFSCHTSEDRLWHYSSNEYWYPGQPQIFQCIYKDKNEVLMEIKAHLNGNIHVRLNQKFALALNVEYGRLKGWIHSGKHAAEEMMDQNAAKYFKSNFTLLAPGFLMIENQTTETKPKPKPETETEIKEMPELCKQKNFFDT